VPTVEIDRRALARGALYGLAIIVPVRAFVLAGFQAGRAARSSPYTHGALAGLAAFTGWLTLRMASHLVLGERLLGKEGDTTITVVATVAAAALLSMSGGILGGLLAARDDGSAS